MKATPFFTICIPSYLSKSTIEEAVKSIYSQKFDDFEILICDQGETNSEFLLSSYDKVKVFHLNEPSAYKARVFLFSKASGKYILSLDSDDTFKEGMFLYLFDLINKTQYDIYFLNEAYSHYFNNDVCLYLSKEVINDVIFEVGLSGVCSKCIKNKKYNFIETDIFQCDDALLSLQIIEQNSSCYFVNKGFYNYNHPSYFKHLKIAYVFDRFKFLHLTRKYYDINDERLFTVLKKNFNFLFYSVYSFKNFRYIKSRKKSEFLDFSIDLYKKMLISQKSKIPWRINLIFKKKFGFILFWNICKHTIQFWKFKEWKKPD